MTTLDLPTRHAERSWIDGLSERLRSEWRLKLCLGLALPVVLAPIYLALERYPIFPTRTFPMSFVDLAIPFSPGWVWVYDSHYLLLQLAWLARTREQIKRFAVGFMIIMAIGFSVFTFFPVVGPRPTDIHPTGMYALLVASDLPLNSFPSLHVAQAIFVACFVSAVMRDEPGASNGLREFSRARAGLNWVLGAWVILIVYSTMATRQHYFADLVPGLLLGWMGHRIAWRGEAR